MSRKVVVSIIQVDECTINRRDALDHILQTLSDVVAVMQGGVAVQDDIDFNVEFVSRVIGLQTLDPLDTFRKAHDQVDEDTTVI